MLMKVEGEVAGAHFPEVPFIEAAEVTQCFPGEHIGCLVILSTLRFDHELFVLAKPQ